MYTGIFYLKENKFLDVEQGQKCCFENGDDKNKGLFAVEMKIAAIL